MYGMRVRFANNILTFYEYEKPIGNYNYYDLQNYFLERFTLEDLSLIDFAKLSKWLRADTAHNAIFYYNDKDLLIWLFDFYKKEQQQISLFDKEDPKVLEYKVLKSNFHAKKDRFIDLVSANLEGNCFFVTLTYNEQNKMLIEDLEVSHKLFTRFTRLLNYNTYLIKKQFLKYVATWELQKKNNRNAIHYHMIVFDFLHKKMDLELLHSSWPYGSVHVKKVNKTTSGVAKYMSKYLLKDIADLVSSKKSYFSSKNLKRPFNDFVIEYDEETNSLILKSGLVINLNDYNIEQIENYTTAFTGKTKKVTYNKKE